MRLGSAHVVAALLAAPATVSAGVVSLDLNRATPEDRVLVKRATFLEQIANNITGGGYYIDVSVGTPPQPARMVLDTGSSDAWVVGTNADLCRSQRLQEQNMDSCSSTYDSSKSSTFSLQQRSGFSIQYLDGSTAEGDYVKDDFTIGGTTIKAMQLGVASKTVRGTGILGVGYSGHVAADEPYPNIIEELVSQQLIPVKAYSLWLNDRRSTAGTILFGGIDTKRFIGPMGVLNIIPDVSTRNKTSFTVVMTETSVTFSNGSSVNVPVPTPSSAAIRNDTGGNGIPTLLDSGTTLSYLPERMTAPLFRSLGAVTERRETGLTFIPCSLLQNERDMVMTFTFGSGGPAIKVPVYELVLDVLLEQSAALSFALGIRGDVCLFGIQSTAQFAQAAPELVSSSFALLGDTFLRSAYVVYDLDHDQIGLAQAHLNATESTIVELSPTETSLPLLTGVASQAANPNSPAFTTITGADGKPTVTQTDNPSGSENAAPRLGGPGNDGRGVLVVMAVSGVCALLGSALFMM